MWIIFVFAALIGILSISVYLLNKISTRKANSFDLDSNNNLSQQQTKRNIDSLQKNF